MKNIYEKYKHILPFALYFFVYMTWFSWLEQRHIWKYQVIHMAVDNYIPFNEVFIIPYFLWFVYVPAVVLYLALHNKDDYYRTAIFLCTGMTVFLLVSTFFPNGHHLRPAVMPRDNIFTQMVASLYKTDTPTNLWPSIHVYNSLGAHFALSRSELGRKMAAQNLRGSLCFHYPGNHVPEAAFRLRRTYRFCHGRSHVRNRLPLRRTHLPETIQNCKTCCKSRA